MEDRGWRMEDGAKRIGDVNGRTSHLRHLRVFDLFDLFDTIGTESLFAGSFLEKAVDEPAASDIPLFIYGAVLRRGPAGQVKPQVGGVGPAEPGWCLWKGGGSVYVILYQPEVDCLTAVDGLQVDRLERSGTISQAAVKPSLESE
jgi:hypothetical protein